MGSCCKKLCAISSCCGKASVIPLFVSDDTISNEVDSAVYEEWLRKSQAMESRRILDFLHIWIRLYAWFVIFGNMLSMGVIHIIPILHLIDPAQHNWWNTCSTTNDGKNIAIGCVLMMHISTIIPVAVMIFVSIFALKDYDLRNLEVYARLLMWNNVAALSFFLYECTNSVMSFVRNDKLFENWLLFCMILLILLGLFLGWILQWNVNQYIKIRKRYVIQYPTTERDIISLVTETYLSYGQIRVMGSHHSMPSTIYVSDVIQRNQLMVSLDYYTGVVFDEENMRATVKAGTVLGLDRNNPLSTIDNGLVHMLQKKGWALADLGGVVMQTVGGFTAMGCAGGSLYHDYYQSVYAIRIIDGTGAVKTYTKPAKNDDLGYEDKYWGVVVSMGLMGIISEITFQCEPSYLVIGSQEQRTPQQWLESGSKTRVHLECGDGTGRLDLFAPIPPGKTKHQQIQEEKYDSGQTKVVSASENEEEKANDEEKSDHVIDIHRVYSLLEFYQNPKFHEKNEYNRIFWWPQVDPNVVTIWKGHRVDPKAKITCKEWVDSGIYHANGDFHGKRYYEVSEGCCGIVEQAFLGFAYNIVNRLIGPPKYELNCCCVCFIKTLIKLFYPTNYGKCAGNPQYYGESWNIILPMDQEMQTKFLPMQFTELWCDIEDTPKVMLALKEFWADNKGLHNTGTFSWEFYPARAGGYNDPQAPGGAWIRPAYGRASFRIDVIWFDVKDRTPYVFYNFLWDFLIKKGIDFRPHWAKWFPGGNVKFPNDSFDTWSGYYASQLPRWKDWLDLRQELDPRNIFLSKYWAYTFGINVDVVID